MSRQRCALVGCTQSFVVGPQNQHQKYHSRSCGEKARKRWLRPERIAYVNRYKRRRRLARAREAAALALATAASTARRKRDKGGSRR
jgi:hypothetical protein